MNRKEFIKTCGSFCLVGIGGLVVTQSCTTTKIVNATLTNNFLSFPLSDFEIIKNNNKQFKRFIIIQNDKLNYPICVYRHTENDFSALLLKCTHQGAELQVFGDKLQCPAHGAEFDNKGNVTGWPADINLKTFKTQIEYNQLKIFLQ